MREEESIFEVDHICLEAGDFSLRIFPLYCEKDISQGLSEQMVPASPP